MSDLEICELTNRKMIKKSQDSIASSREVIV